MGLNMNCLAGITSQTYLLNVFFSDEIRSIFLAKIVPLIVQIIVMLIAGILKYAQYSHAKRGNVQCSSMQIHKRLLLRSVHHFKPDLINDMDHMRISDTELSSVILCQTK